MFLVVAQKSGKQESHHGSLRGPKIPKANYTMALKVNRKKTRKGTKVRKFLRLICFKTTDILEQDMFMFFCL